MPAEHIVHVEFCELSSYPASHWHRNKVVSSTSTSVIFIATLVSKQWHEFTLDELVMLFVLEWDGHEMQGLFPSLDL